MKIFRYNGSPVSFQKGDGVMVNATEMAKPFGKSATHWLRNQSTQEYLQELSALRFRKGFELVQIENGIGCWMHEDVALEFARWLSPAFAIWCNDRIKELLTTGVTTLSHDDETIAQAMAILQKRLEQAKEERAVLEARSAQQQSVIELQASELKEAAPKVHYVDSVLQSVNTYTVQQIAKELDTTANRLYAFLRDRRVMFRQSGTWMLTSRYNGKGYTKTRTHQFTRNDGTVGTSSYTVFTEKGRALIHGLAEGVRV